MSAKDPSLLFMRAFAASGAEGGKRLLADAGFVAPKNLTGTLVEKLVGEIRSGRIGPGERLPTEREMIAAYGVSKTVIREAVAALRSQGYVITRHGIGTFVADFAQPDTFRIDPDDIDSAVEIVNVLQLRLAVETEAAALAAQNATPEGLAGIDDAVAAIDADIAAGNLAIESDFRFHRAIAEATGNPLFPRFLDYLGSLSIPHRRLAMITRVSAPYLDDHAGYMARVQAEHNSIRKAIAAKMPAAARRAIRRHLATSLEKYGHLARNS